VPEVDSSKFGPCNVKVCERSLCVGAVATVAGTEVYFELGLFPKAARDERRVTDVYFFAKYGM
jgi:hypothetical protein